jgi:hypothetical protein
MNIYRSIADGTGTHEARGLAEQLAAWHDAMVRHLRAVGPSRKGSCPEGCPHDEAPALWSAAEQLFGMRARELVFLRTQANRMAGNAMAGAEAGT